MPGPSLTGATSVPPSFVRGLTILALAFFIGVGAPAPGVAESDSVRERNEFYRELHKRQGAATPDDEQTVLLVSGVIGPGAHRQFRAALSNQAPELVVLDGPGGILGEALQIAEEVRRRNMNTLVAPNRRCASACAIVFLSGRTKYLGAGAAVGLHSASHADGRADPEATELMADYLRELGVPSSTLRNMAQTAPNKIRWLTKAEQRAIGIRDFRPTQ